MFKRARDDHANDDSQPPKRARADPSYSTPIPTVHIDTARQLQDLLAFRQDDIPQLRSGIASFKGFLESILYRRDEDARPRNLSILREYLESQKPADVYNTEHPFLSQLWQTWSFATQAHNDILTSSVAAIIALLVRTLSSLLDFREYGLLLSRTVLQNQHLRLVKRGLDAPKTKEFLISPSLRLLTEVASFDGGALCREVYKRREQTFDITSLRRNLGLTRQAANEEEAKRRPAVRTLSVRYILVLLRHLHEGGKNDILKNRSVCISLFQNFRDDPADLVQEILSVTEQFVLKDDELPRSAKATLLTTHNLEKVAGIATTVVEGDPTANHAFAWLKRVCLTPSYGVLRKSAWYPPGTTQIDLQGLDMSGHIDLGLDSLDFYDATGRPDVRNTTLLEWLQTLRPHINLRDRELALACFTVAPELLAAYFNDKFVSLDPKLSNTWLGYASFLFEVVSLEIPPHLGNVEDEEVAQLPPQTLVVLESILPKPLTQKILTKCLNQNPGLITYFATRLLVGALQKLLQIRSQISRVVAQNGTHCLLWREASDRLLIQFLSRCPPLKDFIACFRKIPDDADHAMQKEASARMLRLFYEAAPILAREEPFDISASLTNALASESGGQDSSEHGALQRILLEHYLVIAQKGSGIRWFNKQGSLKYSPVTTLLRLQVGEYQNRSIRDLLRQVLSSHSILDSDDSLDALVASFLNTKPSNDLWTFMHECLARASLAPVKYVDYLEGLVVDEHKEQILPSILAAVVVEQMAFSREKSDVVSWCHLYLEMHQLVLPESLILSRLQDKAKKIEPANSEDQTAIAQRLLQQLRVRPAAADDNEISRKGSAKVLDPLSKFAKLDKQESHDRPELLRWSRKDLESALEDGDVGALMLCLCSQYTDVRRQALQQLHVLWQRLQESTIGDKEGLGVLVGELIETFERQCLNSETALPYLAGTFASHATQLLLDPAHALYSKLNRYMIKSPEWRIQKLPSFWLSITAFSRPDDDDAYWKELQWVLEWLVDGLRTSQDVEILRRSGAFEKVFGIFSSPRAGYQIIKVKVLELIHRAAQLEGGADTLITRAGILAWLDVQTNGTARALRQMVIEASDSSRFEKWAGITSQDAMQATFDVKYDVN